MTEDIKNTEAMGEEEIQVFTLTDKENRVYRCMYCEAKA